MAKYKVLTSKQKKAIEHIKNGKQDPEICSLIHVSISTLWRWRQEEKFKKAIEQITYKINCRVGKKFIGLLEQAQETLQKAMDEKLDDMPGHIKVALELVKIYRPIMPSKDKEPDSQTTESQKSQATDFTNLAKKIEDDMAKQVDAALKDVTLNGNKQ